MAFQFPQLDASLLVTKGSLVEMGSTLSTKGMMAETLQTAKLDVKNSTAANMTVNAPTVGAGQGAGKTEGRS